MEQNEIELCTLQGLAQGMQTSLLAGGPFEDKANYFTKHDLEKSQRLGF